MPPLFPLPIHIQNLSGALNILTSMLTPTLLLSACGSFIISTSARLGRVVDRVRKLADRMEQLLDSTDELEILEERKAMINKHMQWQARRASLLMRAMVSLYIASGLFVLTSVSIGVVYLFMPQSSAMPVILGVLGAIMLLVAAIQLIREARMALEGLHDETDFLQRLTASRDRRIGAKEAS